MARTSEPPEKTVRPYDKPHSARGKPQIAQTYFSGLSRLPLVERHEALTKGAPVKAALSLFESFSTIDRKILLKVIGVSQRTLERRGRTKELLSPEASDRAMRLSEVVELATTVLGGRDLAEDWLRSPAVAFCGHSPLDLITTTGGYDAVKRLLNQVNRGAYA